MDARAGRSLYWVRGVLAHAACLLECVCAHIVCDAPCLLAIIKTKCHVTNVVPLIFGWVPPNQCLFLTGAKIDITSVALTL